MHFMPFSAAGRAGLAVVQGDMAVDLAGLAQALPTTLEAVISGGSGTLAAIRAALQASGPVWRPVSSFTPAYPVTAPHKVICIGLNYALHAKEGGNAIPDYPALFLRTLDSMTSAGAPLVRPLASTKLDYEAELMIVIGKGGRHISEANALDHVFGYTIFNDGSVRDYQRKGAQWTPGKNFDLTGPVGPVVVTADALPPGAHGLRIATRVNGLTVQDSNTADMIFPVARAIAIISEVMTLNPGDMIATGTPQGVGYARTPPLFLKAGDLVEVEIEGIGILANPVTDEATAAA